MRKFKRGSFNPWSMVMVALIAASTIAIVGMLSAPPSTDWAISKLTGQGYVVFASGEYDNIITNQARMQLDNANVRGRAYPWDVNTILTLTDGTSTNVFGARVLLIPKGTFSFGDIPNMIHIVPLIESTSDSGNYLLELEQSSDGVNFTPIGSVRFTGGTTYQTTFAPCRAVNNDTYGIYGRIKTSNGGGQTCTLAFTVSRYILTNPNISSSNSNNFPFN